VFSLIKRFVSLVSKQLKTLELSDAEKRELVSKVYPRLKKRTRVIRLLRIGNALFLALLISACATTTKAPIDKAEKSMMLGVQIKKGLVAGDDPSVFEKSMPTSDIILSSVVRFVKEPTVKRLSNDVIDIDYDIGMLAILKKDRIETNRAICPAILLKDDKYLSVSLSGGVALVTGSKYAILADLKECGILHEMDSSGKGFSLSDKYLLEFTRNSFELYDKRRVKKIFDGSFIGEVVMGRVSGENLMFANENGKIALMSIKTQKYTAMYPDSIDLKEAYFNDGDVYIYDSDNRLTRLTADFDAGLLSENGQTQAKDGCFFLKRSDKMFCDGYIFGLDLAYESPVDADRGLVRDGLIFLIKNGEVNFVDTTLRYKKSLMLASTEKMLCLKEGKAYFKDFDSSVKYLTASGREQKADQLPEVCDHKFNFKDGNLKRPDGKVIYDFADVVNRSENTKMLKRVIDDVIYYYFERLSN